MLAYNSNSFSPNDLVLHDLHFSLVCVGKPIGSSFPVTIITILSVYYRLLRIYK